MTSSSAGIGRGIGGGGAGLSSNANCGGSGTMTGSGGGGNPNCGGAGGGGNPNCCGTCGNGKKMDQPHVILCTMHDKVTTYYANCVHWIVQRKPPLGLRPKYIADAARIQEIAEAISRYVSADMLIPTEWIEEYNQLKGED